MDGDLFRIFAVLDEAHVRYLVVGGVAVVLHGHPRFTADLDLVVSLEEDNALAAIRALAKLGYRPRAPVQGESFADRATRQQWIDEKGLTVLSLWSPEFPATEIDLFVEEPFDFESGYANGVEVDLEGIRTRVCSLKDLLDLKRRAGRPRDLEDIAALEAIASEGGTDV